MINSIAVRNSIIVTWPVELEAAMQHEDGTKQARAEFKVSLQ